MKEKGPDEKKVLVSFYLTWTERGILSGILHPVMDWENGEVGNRALEKLDKALDESFHRIHKRSTKDRQDRWKEPWWKTLARCI